MTEEAKPPICEKHGSEKKWYRNKAHPSGGQWECSQCKNQRDREWRKANPKKQAEATKKWVAENRERKHRVDTQWAKNNSESVKRSRAKYAKTHTEKYQAQNHQRRARKRAATSPLVVVAAAVIAERFALTNGCVYCGADKKLTFDHVVPLSDGGMHVPSNLVGACHSCNSSKNDSPVEDWFREQPFFSEQRWQKILEVTATDDKPEEIN